MCLLLQGYHHILAQRLYFYLGSVAPAIVCRVITLCICSLKHRYDHIYPEITVLSGVYIHALSIFTGEERWGRSSRSYTIFFSSHAPRTSSFFVVHMRNHMVVECRYTITIHKLVCIDVHVYVSYAVLALHGHDT